MRNQLFPALAPELLYPADAVYMARTNLYETRMLGFNNLMLDSVTSMLMGLLNGRATIRHEAGAGPEILDLYWRAGIQINEQAYLYRTSEEAKCHADTLIREGKQLFWPYPLPEGIYAETAHLVSPDVYRLLNNKQNLSSLLSEEHLAQRQLLSHDELEIFEPAEPVFLKAAGVAATGWGFSVFPCPDRTTFLAAREWFRQHQKDIPAVLVERWEEISCCWCAGIVISESGTVCFGGAEQIFSSPAKQSGSVVDSENGFPDEGKSLALQAGEVARLKGFRGIAGLDIGRTTDGRLLVFDPNFRFNASTSQLLFHEAATVRSSSSVSHSFQVTPIGDFRTVTRQLYAPIDEGWFVPTRLFNGEKHPASGGKHIITGFVLGENRSLAEKAAMKLQRLLAA